MEVLGVIGFAAIVAAGIIWFYRKRKSGNAQRDFDDSRSNK
jgi:LPXTG-motif cell wall-anchored protein